MNCKAKAKTTGERCKNAPVSGYEVCRMHGANAKNPGGGPRPQNRNAVTHGAFETLMRERLGGSERAAFDSVPVDPILLGELRILRYKLLRLIGEVDQNVHGKDVTWTVKADDFEKARGIALVVGEIRKLVKEMQGNDLSREMEGFLAGVQTIKDMQGAKDLSE